MSQGKIFPRASDLVSSFAVSDSLGDGITGLTLKFSIYNLGNSMYWDNSSGLFNSVSEVLNTGSEIGQGLYEYVLASAYDATVSEYRVRIEATDTISGDVYDVSDSFIILHDTKTDVSAIKAKTDNLPEAIKKNTAYTKFPFMLFQSADGVSPATGISVTAEVLIDGGAFGAMANSAVEDSDGHYHIDLATSDVNGTFVTFKLSGSGARTRVISFKTTV